MKLGGGGAGFFFLRAELPEDEHMLDKDVVEPPNAPPLILLNPEILRGMGSGVALSLCNKKFSSLQIIKIVVYVRKTVRAKF